MLVGPVPSRRVSSGRSAWSCSPYGTAYVLRPTGTDVVNYLPLVCVARYKLHFPVECTKPSAARVASRLENREREAIFRPMYAGTDEYGLFLAVWTGIRVRAPWKTSRLENREREAIFRPMYAGTDEYGSFLAVWTDTYVRSL